MKNRSSSSSLVELSYNRLHLDALRFPRSSAPSQLLPFSVYSSIPITLLLRLLFPSPFGLGFFAADNFYPVYARTKMLFLCYHSLLLLSYPRQYFFVPHSNSQSHRSRITPQTNLILSKYIFCSSFLSVYVLQSYNITDFCL